MIVFLPLFLIVGGAWLAAVVASARTEGHDESLRLVLTLVGAGICGCVLAFGRVVEDDVAIGVSLGLVLSISLALLAARIPPRISAVRAFWVAALGSLGVPLLAFLLLLGVLADSGGVG